jgi:GMP synthase-like glutamine amidotransferase
VARQLQRRGYTVDTHVVTSEPDQPNVAAPFPDWNAYDLVALMGSIRSLTQKEEISGWVFDELELIREAAANDQPILGICFGGQLIADAMGGSVEVSPVTELGWYEIGSPNGVRNPVGAGPWMQWHHDRFTPPPGAEVLATTGVGPQLFTLGRMAGTQFHPEVDVTHIERWLVGSEDDYLAAHGQDRHRLLAAARENESQSIDGCRRLVDWFLDEVAKL